MVGFVICGVIDEFDIDLMDLFDTYGFNRIGKRYLQIRISVYEMLDPRIIDCEMKGGYIVKIVLIPQSNRSNLHS